VAFQITKNEYGEKLLKPLVNLHVTPNENIINKVGGLLLAKKQGFKTAVFNKHQHYHTHYGGPQFGSPPGYHGEGPIFEGPHPPNFGFGPGAVGPSGLGSFGPPGPPAGPPPSAFGPPAAFGTPGQFGPLGPNYGGPPGFYRDAGSAGGIELDYNPDAYNGTGSGYANQNYNAQDYNHQNYNAQDYNNQNYNAQDYNNQNYNQEQQPNFDYNYQSIYPQASQGQNLQNQYSNGPTGYANSYRNYDAKADNNFNNNNFQSSNSYSYPIPAPAPGAARGSKSVTFPNSRRKRDTDVPVPASLDSDDGPILAELETEDERQATEKNEAQTPENNEKRSVNTEKVINIRISVTEGEKRKPWL
jgi:hypothetical protein